MINVYEKDTLKYSFGSDQEDCFKTGAAADTFLKVIFHPSACHSFQVIMLISLFKSQDDLLRKLHFGCFVFAIES